MQGHRDDRLFVRDRADRELAPGLDPVTLASAPAGDIRSANTDAVGRRPSMSGPTGPADKADRREHVITH